MNHSVPGGKPLQTAEVPTLPSSTYRSTERPSLTYVSMLRIVDPTGNRNTNWNQVMLDLQTVARLNGRTVRALIHSATIHPLASHLSATTQGKKRPFSLGNALELTFRCTLLDYGTSAEAAAHLAAKFLADYERGALDEAPYRVLNLSRRRLSMPSGDAAIPVAMPFGESYRDAQEPLRHIQGMAQDWTIESEGRSGRSGTKNRTADGGAAILIIDLAEIVRRVQALEAQADG